MLKCKILYNKIEMEVILMIGLVDVGGGIRDVYGAGIYDYCLDHNITFPYCIGVSAGSGNLASFLGKQRGRNLRFYKDYINRKEYMSLSNLIHKGSYLDLEYVYGEMTNEGGEDPLAIDNLLSSGSTLTVVATECSTGNPVYFNNKDFVRNDYGILKASCCIPIVCKPYKWHGHEYVDGGVSDPVPIKKAFSDGCDKVVLILTRPLDYRDGEDKNLIFYRLIKKKYPKVYERLLHNHEAYNEALDQVVNEYMPSGKVIVMAPDDCCGVDTLSRNQDEIQRLYDKGYADGEILSEKLNINYEKTICH